MILEKETDKTMRNMVKTTGLQKSEKNGILIGKIEKLYLKGKSSSNNLFEITMQVLNHNAVQKM